MSASISQPSNVAFAPGTIIGGKYRIGGVLGSGGMGVVLSALHLELDAPVAIKIVREDLARDPRIVSRLLFEARAAARMRGSHVVRVLDVARLANGTPYIVMERLEGADLHDVLAERGALSVREAVCHVLQACEGLAEAHGLGIIHRDLKPENLFLATTPEGVVLKILDFGISKDLGAKRRSGNHSTLTKEGMAIGSPYYMSPEQMRASPNLDARSDIWALGAILFELLTNQCPFEADSPARLCAKVMCDEAPSLLGCTPAFPAELDAIVRRCLQKDADARYQTVTELAEALRAFSAADELTSAESHRVESGVKLRPEPLPAPEYFHVTVDHAVEPSTKKTLLQLSAVCAFLTLATIAFWRLQILHESPPWLDTRHAAAAELPTRPPPPRSDSPAPPSVAPATAPPIVAVSPPERVATAVPHPSTAELPRPTPAAAPPPARRAVAPAPSPPRAQWRPRADSAASPEPDGPASRYGL